MTRRLLALLLGWGLSLPAFAAATDTLIFSLVRDDDGYRGVLLVSEHAGGAEVVDLAPLGHALQTPPQLVAAHGFDAVAAFAASAERRQVPASELTILPWLGDTHIAAGTNYADHQEETESSEVFLFPKFGRATAGNPGVATGPGVLLDYEIEICALFDREIASLEDFAGAVTGFYLCSDFTDRALLLRLLDVGDLASGRGFSDAKSGDDRFAVADRVVVARDWRGFIEQVPLQLSVNDVLRQDAYGGDMILKLDEIVSRALAEGLDDRWRYRGEPVVLLEGGTIEAGQSVLTGTPGGVLMQIPSMGYLLLKFFKWLFTLAWLELSLYEFLVNEFVADAEAEGTFLQPGDRVHMRAGELGEIRARVTAAGAG